MESAARLLDAIDSSPRTHEALYSGHVRPAGADAYCPGEELVIPLMAASGSLKLADVYSQRPMNGSPAHDPLVQGAIEVMGEVKGLDFYRRLILPTPEGHAYRQPTSQSTIFRFTSGLPAAYYRHNERLVSGRFRVDEVHEVPVKGGGQYLGEDGFHPVTQRFVSLNYLGPAERDPHALDEYPADDDYDC
jgi:hypothetical protein